MLLLLGIAKLCKSFLNSIKGSDLFFKPNFFYGKATPFSVNFDFCVTNSVAFYRWSLKMVILGFDILIFINSMLQLYEWGTA